MKMEPLNRVYRARVFDLLFVGVLLVVLEVVLIALLSVESPVINSWLLLFPLMTVLGMVLGVMTRLEIIAEVDTFSVSVRLFGMMIYYHEEKGRSWHAISRPCSTVSGADEGSARYRVEVAGEDGSRQVVLGWGLCWVYGVDYL